MILLPLHEHAIAVPYDLRIPLVLQDLPLEERPQVDDAAAVRARSMPKKSPRSAGPGPNLPPRTDSGRPYCFQTSRVSAQKPKSRIGQQSTGR